MVQLKKESLSKEQKAELERLRPWVVRQGLVARLTGSDWRLALNAVLAIPGYQAWYRLRQVRDQADPPAGAWQGPVPAGLPLYNYIEWLELRLRQDGRDFSAALTEALAAARIAYRLGPDALRIEGYTRNGKGA